MKVTLTEIKEKFDALVTESESREAIANFAERAMKADDAGLLEMEPVSCAETIWDSLSYLTGVDLQTAPNIYLHSVQDFIGYRNKLNI
jgi:hypothetical protein